MRFLSVSTTCCYGLSNWPMSVSKDLLHFQLTDISMVAFIVSLISNPFVYEKLLKLLGR